ncbi:peptidase S41 [Paenibacillus sp. 32O-W]|uniref:S41 family peptidase n=1 Tax=Paenibacillus sp. 32O-W TaxID=1695218 RepID=UPI00071F2533|nr:S41 family peptidase [Paenibacillus sp. 32O-W]ALS26124.1 peptidase S41 [Paenibacillus sp. 32O-W]
MQFKGRTVAAFVLLTMVASVLVTLTVTEGLYGIPSAALQSGTAPAVQAGQSGLSGEEMNKLNAVVSLIESKFYRDVDRNKLVDGAINGMMGALDDPYSVYMEKDTAKHFSEEVVGSFTGIGAEVTMENGKVVIVSAIKGSPAEKAGLLAKDVIVSVNGEKLAGVQLSDAVAKIRGPKGTKAKLQIMRDGVPQPIELELVRDEIDVETVFAKLRPDGIGVIEIRQFSLHTGERFAEELESLESRGMKGLVIDVRNNPGGVLPVVVSVAQPFVPEGKPIVMVEDRSGKREMTVSKGSGKPYPVAVLVNKGSASASEVLAGALGEAGGAVIVGETTFGKGTVQVSYDKVTGDGSLIKMTVAKWLTPKGNWIHEKGIKPDVEAKPPAIYTVPRLSRSAVLKKEAIGQNVRSLQVMLDGTGYEPGRKDGYFSDETEEAVIRFQRDSGLPATGQVDDRTATALELKVIERIRDERYDTQLQRAVEVVLERIGR